MLLKDLTILQELSLADNRIASLPRGLLENQKILRKLYLHNNRLTEMENDFGKLLLLQDVYLSGNRISCSQDRYMFGCCFSAKAKVHFYPQKPI